MWLGAHVCGGSQLHVIITQVFGGASWMWLVPTCVAVAIIIIIIIMNLFIVN